MDTYGSHARYIVAHSTLRCPGWRKISKRIAVRHL